MKFKILNRVNEVSVFREALLQLLKVEGNELILGYGFFTEEILNEKTYDEEKKKSENKFIKSMIEGFKNSKKEVKITIIGKYGSNKSSRFRSYYNNAKRIKDELEKVLNLKCNMNLLLSKKDNYHKKIAIKTDEDGQPMCMILGSSNLSKNAFGKIDKNFYYSSYNQELDIVFCRNNCKIIEDLIKDRTSDKKDIEYGVNYDIYSIIDSIGSDIETKKDFHFCYPMKNEKEKEKIFEIEEKYVEYIGIDIKKGEYKFKNEYEEFFSKIISSTKEEIKNYLEEKANNNIKKKEEYEKLKKILE